MPVAIFTNPAGTADDQVWVVPAGVEKINTVECWGAGGSGGTGGLTNGGGGGGGGAYSRKANVTVTPGASVAVKVGHGTTGAVGGDAWFKSAADVMAKGGGLGGSTSGIGAGGTAGGPGAAASGAGDTKFSGGSGAAGTTATGGGGGSGAGSAENGNNATTGTGGSPPAHASQIDPTKGGGGGGPSNATGNDFGAGGGGGIVSGAGKPGNPGVVLIEWTEVANLTSVVAPADAEAIKDDKTVTSIVAPADVEAIADKASANTSAGFSRYVEEVLADSPRHYYRLSEASPFPGMPLVNLGTLGAPFGGPQVGIASNWASVAGGLPRDGSGGFRAVDDLAKYLAPAYKTAVAYDNYYDAAVTFTQECFFKKNSINAAGEMLWASSNAADGRPYFYIQKTLFSAVTIALFAPRGNVGGAGSALVWTIDTAGSQANFPLATWNHVAMTWNGSTKTAELFINGVSFGALVSTTDIIGPPAFGGIFGEWYQGAAIWPMLTDSAIDEVAIYPTVLSAARIKAHYDARLQGFGSEAIAESPALVSVAAPMLTAEAIADRQDLTSITVPTDVEALADRTDLTSGAAFADVEAIADAVGVITIVALTVGESILSTRDVVSVALAQLAQEAIAETDSLTSVAAFALAQALVDTASVTSITVPTDVEAIADRADLITIADFIAGQALAEIDSLTSIAFPTGGWRLISPGLEGIVYDESGSVPIPGAQVLLFRDDNTLVATLTADGAGHWAIDLDPAYMYWVSGWLDGPTQVEDETDRHIPPVETEIASGTAV